MRQLPLPRRLARCSGQIKRGGHSLLRGGVSALPNARGREPGPYTVLLESLEAAEAVGACSPRVERARERGLLLRFSTNVALHTCRAPHGRQRAAAAAGSTALEAGAALRGGARARPSGRTTAAGRGRGRALLRHAARPRAPRVPPRAPPPRPRARPQVALPVAVCAGRNGPAARGTLRATHRASARTGQVARRLWFLAGRPRVCLEAVLRELLHAPLSLCPAPSPGGVMLLGAGAARFFGAAQRGRKSDQGEAARARPGRHSRTCRRQIMPREIITLQVGQCGNQSAHPCPHPHPRPHLRLPCGAAVCAGACPCRARRAG